MFDLLLVLVAVVGVIVMIVRAYRGRAVSAERAANWPEVEGTIQGVNQMVVNAGRSSYTVDVADFSYSVNGEYYSGRLRVSQGFSGGDDSTKVLIDRKVRVLYDPQTPEAFSFPEQNVEGFGLVEYVGLDGDDVNPIDLNIA